MVARPGATWVTVAVAPLPATVATVVSLLLHAYVPPAGVPVAVSVPVVVLHTLNGLGASVTWHTQGATVGGGAGFGGFTPAAGAGDLGRSNGGIGSPRLVELQRSGQAPLGLRAEARDARARARDGGVAQRGADPRQERIVGEPVPEREHHPRDEGAPCVGPEAEPGRRLAAATDEIPQRRLAHVRAEPRVDPPHGADGPPLRGPLAGGSVLVEHPLDPAQPVE